MELIETIPQFIEVLWCLRYIIAIPFVVLGTLMAWGWWNNITV